MSASSIISKGSFSEKCLLEFEVLIFSFSAFRIFGLLIISFQMLLCDPVSHYASSFEAGKLVHTVMCHQQPLFTVQLIQKLVASVRLLLNS